MSCPTKFHWPENNAAEISLLSLLHYFTSLHFIFLAQLIKHIPHRCSPGSAPGHWLHDIIAMIAVHWIRPNGIPHDLILFFSCANKSEETTREWTQMPASSFSKISVWVSWPAVRAKSEKPDHCEKLKTFTKTKHTHTHHSGEKQGSYIVSQTIHLSVRGSTVYLCGYLCVLSTVCNALMTVGMTF